MARSFQKASRYTKPLLVAMAAVVSLSQAEAATSGPLLAHQAVYELSLKKSRGGNAIGGARGRILYNFSGSACEGYITEFRQVSELNSGEGKISLSDLRWTAWEDAAGKSYRFKIDSRSDDSAASPVDGVAERDGDHVNVKLKQPEAKTFTLDGSTVFPTQQVERIIAAAREGKSVLELTVYDASENGQKVFNTLAVIGQAIPGDRVTAAPDPSITNDTMKSLKRWPVTVSYYDRDSKAKEGEQTPVYSMSFELFENGVSRSLVLDYNDFVIAGTLQKLEIKDSKPCK